MKRLLTCLWAVTLAAAVSVGVTPGSEGHAAPVVLDAVALQGGGDGDGGSGCLLCLDMPFYCSEGEHDAFDHEYNPTSQRGAGAHSLSNRCFDGSCSEKHPTCQGFADASMEMLKASIRRNDALRIQGMMESRTDGLVAFNAERSAIQLVNCSGAVVAHFPVSDVLSQELRRMTLLTSATGDVVAE